MAFDPSWTTRRLVARREELARQLPLGADFTPGSVSETYSKCGRPACHCAREGDPGHGPRLLWVRYERGATKSRTVPGRLAGRMRAGIDRFHEFTGRVQEIADINAVLAERDLLGPGRAPAARPGPAGEKGGSATGSASTRAGTPG